MLSKSAILKHLYLNHSCLFTYFTLMETINADCFGQIPEREGTSHWPVFMGSCLTISHTCLPCLSSSR